ncbi:MAG: HWE histidine kinase domain-containing protein [Pseudomonadota bacterium]
MGLKSENELRCEVQRLEGLLAKSMAERDRATEFSRMAAQRLSMLEAVLDVVPVGVVLADADGKIILGNSRVESMLRHPVLHSKDVDSYQEWMAFDENGRRIESHEYPLSRVIRDGEEHAEIDVHYQRGDGTRFWLRAIGGPVRSEEGALIGAAVALLDIDAERQLMAQQAVLIAELNHRVKNAFSVVKSIVSQSLRKMRVEPGLRDTIDRRLDAYANAHATLVGSTWERAPIAAVADDILPNIGGARIAYGGPAIELPSRQALALSMAFYELGTNAVKYGALSVPTGKVALEWSVAPGADDVPTLTITWTESGGPPAEEPKSKGFGSVIIDRALAMETGGTVDISYAPEGFAWRLTMPVQERGVEE